MCVIRKQLIPTAETIRITCNLKSYEIKESADTKDP